jgi:hypothetical protein
MFESPQDRVSIPKDFSIRRALFGFGKKLVLQDVGYGGIDIFDAGAGDGFAYDRGRKQQHWIGVIDALTFQLGQLDACLQQRRIEYGVFKIELGREVFKEVRMCYIK